MPGKYILQNKDSQTNEYFSSILRNVFQDSLVCPILNLKQNIFKNLIVSFSANLKKNPESKQIKDSNLRNKC
jgi:hypothetical protein